jgi:hypothetical protein
VILQLDPLFQVAVGTVPAVAAWLYVPPEAKFKLVVDPLIAPPLFLITPVEETVTPEAVVMVVVVKALLVFTCNVPDISAFCVVVVIKLKVNVAVELPKIKVEPLLTTKAFEAAPIFNDNV